MRNEHAGLNELRRRFALRLEAALDALGYPLLKAGRVRSLANGLAVDTSVATALMSLLHLPDYPQLLDLCKLLGQQPGYFLDAKVLDVPRGSCVVKPMDIGEDLVRRLPSEVVSADGAAAGLRYWRTTVPMGFGIGAGEYLVALGDGDSSAAEPWKLYLHYGEHAVDVLQCVDLQCDRAVFHRDAATSVPLIVPTGRRATQSGQLRKLMASIRCGSNLHVRT